MTTDKLVEAFKLYAEYHEVVMDAVHEALDAHSALVSQSEKAEAFDKLMKTLEDANYYCAIQDIDMLHQLRG